ncbi:MAG: energy-coupling factor transporter transmembrane protein EcfT [Aerococcus sp.]|nr:energy-coupling factor transporter transmembrane protein EcfT [Aerococcus sp.]
MANQLILGRYLPGDSLIHRLDPRMKIIAMFFLLAIIFFANNWWTYLLLFAFVMVAILQTGISVKIFIRGLRPMLFLIVLTVLLQLFFTKQGAVIFEIGPIALTEGGLVNAFFILMRFVFIIFISTILTLTTSPLDITNAIESLFSPLKNILPIHEMALMLSIALRFVPTLLDETDTIMDAQRARGVDFSEGNLMQRAQSFLPILIPLFISAFDRAYDLSTAMEARGYHGSDGRTKYRLLHWQTSDTLMLGLVFVVGVLVVGLRQW